MDFTDEQRAIFVYHNGEREVRGDPLRLRRRLVQILGDESALVGKINAANAGGADLLAVVEGCNAADILVDGVRAAFGLVAYDDATGRGAPDAHVLGVYAGFCDYLKKNATSTDSPQTSSLPTGSISETPNTAAR